MTDTARDLSASIPETVEGEAVYIEIIDSCNHAFDGDCLRARSGPGTDFQVVDRFRTGVVLRVSDKVVADGFEWFKISYGDQKLYYPERLPADIWIANVGVREFVEETPTTEWEDGVEETNKRIVVDLSDQTLKAYDGETLFMETTVSTGEEFSPTKVGSFEVFKMMPTRYMQGPIPGSGLTDEYDLPGVPWDLYFTYDGAVIHGAYWHDEFGDEESHGCVNLRPSEAKKLYDWAVLGTLVVVEA